LKQLPNEANFTGTTFCQLVDFNQAKFSNEANFTGAKFSNEANFTGAKFPSKKGKILFIYILFEKPNKVTFAESNLSKVSFRDSDITRIRFGDEISWGGRDEFTIIEEQWLKEQVRKEQKGEKQKAEGQVSLEDVLSVYRNLRENYEFRLRYDEAGKFFIKEMELKRKYREAPTISPIKQKLWPKLKGDNSPIPNIEYVLRRNGWLRRNFSLNGLYYHFSRYGESIWRPTAIGAITIGLSTLLWLIHNNPTAELSFSNNSSIIVNNSSNTIDMTSNFINVTRLEVWNSTHWQKAFERSFADFLPLLSLGSDIKAGIIDYIVKIFGGGLTFVLLTIALRRKFERKYTR
jgi:hypothetical protein